MEKGITFLAADAGMETLNEMVLYRDEDEEEMESNPIFGDALNFLQIGF